MGGDGCLRLGAVAALPRAFGWHLASVGLQGTSR